jgi:hypothetical protein
MIRSAHCADAISKPVCAESPTFFRSIPANLWDTVGLYDGSVRTSERTAFSSNNRTMDWAMGAFLAVVSVPKIRNLRAVNTVDS